MADAKTTASSESAFKAQEMAIEQARRISELEREVEHANTIAMNAEERLEVGTCRQALRISNLEYVLKWTMGFIEDEQRMAFAEAPNACRVILDRLRAVLAQPAAATPDEELDDLAASDPDTSGCPGCHSRTGLDPHFPDCPHLDPATPEADAPGVPKQRRICVDVSEAFEQANGVTDDAAEDALHWEALAKAVHAMREYWGITVEREPAGEGE